MSTALIACVLLTSAPFARAQLEGTLFTSPEERAYLDYLREEFLTRSQDQGFDIEVSEIPTVPVEGAEAAPPQPVEFTLGAIITRRDGARTVWINNQSMEESELPDFLAVIETNGIAALQVTHEGRRFVVKPGQTVNLTTGEILEAYQRPQAQEPVETPPPSDEGSGEPESAAESTPAESTDAAGQDPTPEQEVASSPGEDEPQSGSLPTAASAAPALTEREAKALEIMSNLSDYELDVLTELIRPQNDE